MNLLQVNQKKSLFPNATRTFTVLFIILSCLLSVDVSAQDLTVFDAKTLFSKQRISLIFPEDREVKVILSVNASDYFSKQKADHSYQLRVFRGRKDDLKKQRVNIVERDSKKCNVYQVAASIPISSMSNPMSLANITAYWLADNGNELVAEDYTLILEQSVSSNDNFVGIYSDKIDEYFDRGLELHIALAATLTPSQKNQVIDYMKERRNALKSDKVTHKLHCYNPSKIITVEGRESDEFLIANIFSECEDQVIHVIN